MQSVCVCVCFQGVICGAKYVSILCVCCVRVHCVDACVLCVDVCMFVAWSELQWNPSKTDTSKVCRFRSVRTSFKDGMSLS